MCDADSIEPTVNCTGRSTFGFILSMRKSRKLFQSILVLSSAISLKGNTLWSPYLVLSKKKIYLIIFLDGKECIKINPT